MEELGLEPSRYEGPTGIVGVLLDACRNEGISSLSLWAAVPHYVSLAPSPRAALALCDASPSCCRSRSTSTELEQAADEYSEQVSEAVSSDADTASYVEELERRVDMLNAEENLPVGRHARRRADPVPARAGRGAGRSGRGPRGPAS